MKTTDIILFKHEKDSRYLQLSYSASTRNEMLNSNILSHVDLSSCQRIQESEFEATHVVVGISYGGSCNMRFKKVCPLITIFALCSNAFILQKKSAIDNRKFENLSVTAQGEVFGISTGSHSIVDLLTDESYQDFSKNLEIEVGSINVLYFSFHHYSALYY